MVIQFINIPNMTFAYGFLDRSDDRDREHVDRRLEIHAGELCVILGYPDRPSSWTSSIPVHHCNLGPWSGDR